MAYARHVKITMSGRIGNPVADRFSMSVAMSEVAANILSPWDDTTDYAVGLKNDCVAFFGRANTRIANTAVLDTVKVAFIGPNPLAGVVDAKGKKGGPGIYERDAIIFSVNQPGQVAAANPPIPQVSLAVSLNTDRRGPSGKGRFFLPQPAVGINPADGFRMSATDAAAINGSVEEFVEALNNQPGIDWQDAQVVVASTKGYNTPVTSVRTGRRLDIVCSRANRISENYSPTLDVD